ncbi:MAG: hypothetical protein JWP49_1915 [Phenylobacterium sp.]|jgi:uncharacterized membrane protein|nr:hypothetical protein [Phenylobacterium sp.]
MTTLSDIAPRKLDLGRVMSQTAAVIGRQPLLILGLGVVLGGLPSIVSGLTIRPQMANPAAFMGSGLYWLQTLVLLLINSYLQACLYHVIFAALGNRKAGVGEVLTTGAKFFLPLFAVNLLYYLACIVGMVLLLVPGIMIGVAWCVAGPALIAERSGITAVFGRSAELTRHNRWRIFGLAVIFVIAIFIIEGVLGAIGLARGFNFNALAAYTPAIVIGSGIVTGLVTAFSTTVVAVLYAELRELKQGLGGESLAEVFD